MLYELAKYVTETSFNEDAKVRYDTVIAARTATSYDAFWRIEHVIKVPDGYFYVVWSRPAPLRKH